MSNDFTQLHLFTVAPRVDTKAPRPVYFGLSANFSLPDVIAAAKRLKLKETTEAEIGSAIASGVLNDGQLLGFSYAARFWAAIRRFQSDCSVNLSSLARISGIDPTILYHYRRTKSRTLATYFAADELDYAALSMNQ